MAKCNVCSKSVVGAESAFQCLSHKPTLTLCAACSEKANFSCPKCGAPLLSIM